MSGIDAPPSRPADQRGLLAFHDELPDARLIAVINGALAERNGPIEAIPLDNFLRRVVPGEALR